jgi:hypothetical protein
MFLLSFLALLTSRKPPLFSNRTATVAKDYLLDNQGFDSSHNTTFAIGTGSKVGQVLAPTGGTELDAHYVEWGSMYHDVAGAIGTANRLHYWYQGYRWKTTTASNYDWGGLYAYSDDYGATWTRPNLGLVSYNGNTNNNILFTTVINAAYQTGHFVLVGVTVRPGDAKPFKFVLSNNQFPAFNIFVYESAYADFHDGGTLLKSGYFWDHAESGGTYDGKVAIFEQDIDTGERFATAEFLTNIVSDPWETARNGAHRAIYGGQNCVTSATTQVSPEVQNHGGSFVTDYADLWGRIAVISPQGAAPTGDRIHWNSEFCTLRGYDTGIFQPTDVKRLDSPSSYLLPKGTYNWNTWPLGTVFTGTGQFDGGSLSFLSNGRITKADGSDRFFYAGFYSTQDQQFDAGMDHETQDLCGVGAIDFDVDRESYVTSTGSGAYFITKEIDTTGPIYVNYNGPLKVELLNVGDNSVISGYDQASCDLTNIDSTHTKVTWGGSRDASGVGAKKIKFYVTGVSLYAYELTGGGSFNPLTASIIAIF